MHTYEKLSAVNILPITIRYCNKNKECKGMGKIQTS